MNRPEPVLSLLGLSLRGGHLEVGEEPVDAVCRSQHCRLRLLAGDAAENTVRRAKHFADVGACILLTLPYTKADLGQAVGRASAAIVAVTDIGLAAAVARRLALIDPARYGKAVEQLDTKARRAQQRREEQRAHEKNVRTGRYKGAAPQPQQQEEEPVQQPRKAPSKRDGTPRKEFAPKRDGAYKRDGAPKKDYAPKRDGDRNRDGAPKREFAPKGEGAYKKDGAYKKSGPSRYGDKDSRDRTSSSRSSGYSGKKGNKQNPYAHSRPVKKGKGSFRSSER